MIHITVAITAATIMAAVAADSAAIAIIPSK